MLHVQPTKEYIMAMAPWRPQSEVEYRTLIDRGLQVHKNCVCCNTPFSGKNVFTPSGWRETQISGMCEKCFDDLFKEDEPGDESIHGYLRPINK